MIPKVIFHAAKIMQVFKMTKIYRFIFEKMDDTMETESMESGVRETD